MFSMQLDVSSERSQSQNDMTETKAKFVGCWLAENTKKIQKNTMLKLSTRESCHIHAVFNRIWLIQTYKHCGSSRDKKSKARYTYRENGTHYGNIFPFNFSTNLVRTWNLDAYHRYTCMRKWSAQRAWNIKVNNSKQTLKNMYTNATFKAVDIRPFFHFLIRSLFSCSWFVRLCASPSYKCALVWCVYIVARCITALDQRTSVCLLHIKFLLCVEIKHCQKHCEITLANTKYRNDNQIHIQIRIFNHISLVIWLSDGVTFYMNKSVEYSNHCQFQTHLKSSTVFKSELYIRYYIYIVQTLDNWISMKSLCNECTEMDTRLNRNTWVPSPDDGKSIDVNTLIYAIKPVNTHSHGHSFCNAYLCL